MNFLCKITKELLNSNCICSILNLTGKKSITFFWYFFIFLIISNFLCQIIIIILNTKILFDDDDSIATNKFFQFFSLLSLLINLLTIVLIFFWIFKIYSCAQKVSNFGSELTSSLYDVYDQTQKDLKRKRRRR